MSLGINNCAFAGYLGKDPELTDVNGTQKARFTIAVTETWRDKQGAKQERTEWISCEAWRKTAELIATYFSKGDPIYVTGKYRTNEYEKDGRTERYRFIEVDHFAFLPNPRKSAGPDAGVTDNHIPF